MSAGQWAELTVSGGIDSGIFVTDAVRTYDYCNKMVYDPVGKRLMFIGQGHERNQLWHSYDETANTFGALADPPWDTGGSGDPGYLGHGYQHNALDPATGDFFYKMTGGGTLRKFTRSGSSWGTIASAQTSGNAIAGALEWHPGIGDDGGLIWVIGEYVTRWDSATDSWSTVTSSLSGPQNHAIAHYSAPHGLVLFSPGNGDSTALYSVGASGGITTRADCPIGMGVTIGISACCPVSGDLLVLGSAGAAHQYDVTGDAWDTLSLTGAPSFGTIGSGSGIIAAQVPEHGVIAFLFCSAEELWLYKHAAA